MPRPDSDSRATTGQGTASPASSVPAATGAAPGRMLHIAYDATVADGSIIPFAGRFTDREQFDRMVAHECSSLGHNWQSVEVVELSQIVILPDSDTDAGAPDDAPRDMTSHAAAPAGRPAVARLEGPAVAETDVRMGTVMGRNGAASVGKLRFQELNADLVSIDFISAATGRVINGGGRVDRDAMDRLALAWCQSRGLIPPA